MQCALRAIAPTRARRSLVNFAALNAAWAHRSSIVVASLEKKVDAQFGAISEHSSKALKRPLPHG